MFLTPPRSRSSAASNSDTATVACGRARRMARSSVMLDWMSAFCWNDPAVSPGDEISKQFRVAQVGKIPIYFRGKLPWSISFEVRIKFQHFRSERFGFYGRGGFGFEGLNHSNWEWRFLLKSAESDAFESLQNQVRCAVASFNACPNKTNAGDVKKVLGRIPLDAMRFEQRNAKHAVMGQGVL